MLLYHCDVAFYEVDGVSDLFISVPLNGSKENVMMMMKLMIIMIMTMTAMLAMTIIMLITMTIIMTVMMIKGMIMADNVKPIHIRYSPNYGQCYRNLGFQECPKTKAPCP